MKNAVKKAAAPRKLKRTLAFILALTIVGTLVAIPGTAMSMPTPVPQKEAYADNYRSVFPSLTSAKLKLQDPKLSDKQWYEYAEYEQFTEVVDGDITFRIFRPTDYAASSIMAIGDYQESNISAGNNEMQMDMGDLQAIFDLAAKGSSISSAFSGKQFVNTIADSMTSMNDFVDNSKYYASPQQLGIPGDASYNGISNSGFYSASSIEITLEKTTAIEVGKTLSANSDYAITESNSTSKNYSSYVDKTIGTERSRGSEVSSGYESSRTSGWSLDHSLTKEESNSHAYGNTITDGETSENSWNVGAESGYDIGSSISTSATAGVDIMGLGKTEVEVGAEVSSNFHSSISGEIGGSSAVSNEVSIMNQNERGTMESDSFSSGFSSSETSTSSISKTVSEGASINAAITQGGSTGGETSSSKDASVAIGYGVDYSAAQQTGYSQSVARTFDARTDEEVANAGWKLCKYVVKVPYYIEVVKTETDTAGNSVESALYSQYVTYNLLSGVCRVFTNGYIEHWYTGELVPYADFFEGFITASELVDKAKAQAKLNIKGGE